MHFQPLDEGVARQLSCHVLVLVVLVVPPLLGLPLLSASFEEGRPRGSGNGKPIAVSASHLQVAKGEVLCAGWMSLN